MTTLLAGWLPEDKFCYSSWAVANNIKNIMDDKARSNAWRLAEVMKWILDWYHIPYSEFLFDSGFRNNAVNNHFGGSWAHNYGCAIDCTRFGRRTIWPLKVIFNDIVSGKVKNPKGIPVIKYIDQIIFETHTGNPWLHIGVAKSGTKARNQSMLSYKKNNGSVNYKNVKKI